MEFVGTNNSTAELEETYDRQSTVVDEYREAEVDMIYFV